jgi:hypothetical protein
MRPVQDRSGIGFLISLRLIAYSFVASIVNPPKPYLYESAGFSGLFNTKQAYSQFKLRINPQL